jgi:hypothetical protein
MSTPTLINLPPPPSDPVTPSDMGPGTPNSGTTSLSALSTTAFKDGHQGQTHSQSHHTHHSSSASHSSTTVLDAERADRISRLAGLERVAATRAGSSQALGQAGMSAVLSYVPGYFDGYSQLKERSTVGSASATTGSVGGYPTWTSNSDALDADKMSEDPDDGVSSVGGLSDEGNASLVGFGEGSSTISGPVSSSRIPSTGGRPGSFGSPTPGRVGPTSFHSQYVGGPMGGPRTSSPSPARSNTPEPFHDVRMVDGVTYDADVVDTTVRTPRLVTLRSQSAGANDGHSFGDLVFDQESSR